MPLLEMTDLASDFAGHLRGANHVDIAVAWLGPSQALNKLLERGQNSNFSARIVVGLSGNSTSPVALLALRECKTIKLRIAIANSGIFHPKFYLFHKNDGKICWVGSANFTFSGFERNQELIMQFKDSGCEGEVWFEKLWASLLADQNDIDKIIEEYTDNWVRPLPPPESYQPKTDRQVSPLRLFEKIETWLEFLDAVQRCDRFWQDHTKGRFSVLGESWSWLDTIQHGFGITRRLNWKTLTLQERRILLGIEARPCSGRWGLLGGMGAAATAVGAFHNNSGLRQKIREALQPSIDAKDPDGFVRAAQAFIDFVSNQNGFGPALATRFLSLAAPDRAISVNGGSAPHLSQLTGLSHNPNTLGNSKNYSKLLHWLYVQSWYSPDKPHSSFELMIWSARAALMDCFVYDPT